MSDRTFLDTNVLVYCFDAGAPKKRDKALAIVDGSIRDVVISTQVLQEFYVTVTRKLARPLHGDDAEEAARELAALPIIGVGPSLVLEAIGTSRRMKLSFWDALILHSASSGGCSKVLSEDLQHGFRFKDLVVENPFLSS